MLPAVTAIDPNAAALPDSGIFGLDSSEAESRVVLVRQEADAQRYRFDAQVQARVRTLDERAKDEAESAALWSAILWLVTAAVVFAGWLWLT